MKTVIAFVLATALSAPGFSANLRHANLYTCSSKDLQVSLATSSLIGMPQLYLNGQTVAGYSFSETELTQTRMGYQAAVSVTNVNDASIDYTLIVPLVNIQNREPSEVKALLIKTLGGGLIDPGRVPGPMQNNSVTKLSCMAESVDF